MRTTTRLPTSRTVIEQKSPGGQIDASFMDEHMATMLIQAQIAAFGGFSLIVTDGHPDTQTYGRTDALTEMRGSI